MAIAISRQQAVTRMIKPITHAERRRRCCAFKAVMKANGVHCAPPIEGNGKFVIFMDTSHHEGPTICEYFFDAQNSFGHFSCDKRLIYVHCILEAGPLPKVTYAVRVLSGVDLVAEALSTKGKGGIAR